jgi:hypothetical protein
MGAQNADGISGFNQQAPEFLIPGSVSEERYEVPDTDRRATESTCDRQ